MNASMRKNSGLPSESPRRLSSVSSRGRFLRTRGYGKFSAYFHVDLDALRFGHSKGATSHQELLSSNPATETVQYRKVPYLHGTRLANLRGGATVPLKNWRTR